MTDGGFAANDPRTHSRHSAVDDPFEIPIAYNVDIATGMIAIRVADAAAQVIQTKEKIVHDALIALGWTPPPATPKRDFRAEIAAAVLAVRASKDRMDSSSFNGRGRTEELERKVAELRAEYQQSQLLSTALPPAPITVDDLANLINDIAQARFVYILAEPFSGFVLITKAAAMSAIELFIETSADEHVDIPSWVIDENRDVWISTREQAAGDSDNEQTVAVSTGFEEQVRAVRSRSSFPQSHHVEGQNFVD